MGVQTLNIPCTPQLLLKKRQKLYIEKLETRISISPLKIFAVVRESKSESDESIKDRKN